jgi:hypothetical protein
VRENSPELGDLQADFDFNQAPRAPVLLSVHPQTDLIRHAAGNVLSRSGPPGVGTGYVIIAAARFLGVGSFQLFQELSAGKTGSQIAAENGTTLGAIEQAVTALVIKHLRGGPLIGQGLGANYVIQQAADSLGVPVAQVRADLAAGETLSQIAAQHGLTLSQLSQKVLAALAAQMKSTLRS